MINSKIDNASRHVQTNYHSCQQLDQITALHICPAQKTFQMQAGTGGQARQGKKRVRQLPYLNECDKFKWSG